MENKIFSDTDELLDTIFTFINHKNREDDSKIDIYIELSTRQIIKLDSILSPNKEVSEKRRSYILAVQNYIYQLEDVKSGESRTIMITNDISKRETYLPQTRDSEYAFSSSYDTYKKFL
jgi:predicted RNase H-like nuclease